VPGPIDLAFTIDIVDASIADAASRGDGAGLLELGRKLQAVSGDPPPPSTRREIERARVELERDIWVATIDELLLPAVKDAFVAALHGDVDNQRAGDDQDRRARDDRHHHRSVTSDDPWAELDPRELQALDRAVEVRSLRAQKAAIEACRHYEKTRKTSHLRDAVREIDAAVSFRRNRLSSGLAPGAREREAERLGHALSAALSPRAFRFFVVLIRGQIAIELEGRSLLRRSSDRDGMEAQLLSKGEWADPLDQPLRSEVPCFVDGVQQRFDDELERERLKEEAEERRLRDAQERLRAWQALRDEDARLAQTEGEEDGGVELLDAGTSVSSAESAEALDVELGDRSVGEPLKRVEDDPQDERGVIVDVEHGRLAPPGSVYEAMNPDMAAVVEEERKRQARLDAVLARRKADRQEYLDQLRSRA
jgi:hypothetical protein